MVIHFSFVLLLNIRDGEKTGGTERCCVFGECFVSVKAETLSFRFGFYPLRGTSPKLLHNNQPSLSVIEMEQMCVRVLCVRKATCKGLEKEREMDWDKNRKENRRLVTV